MKLTNLIFELIFVGSLAAWQAGGIDGAGNVFRFMAWAVVVLMFLSAFSGVDALRKVPKSGLIWRTYVRIRSAAVGLTCAWLGLTWLAAFWFLSWACLFVAQTSAKEAA